MKLHKHVLSLIFSFSVLIILLLGFGISQILQYDTISDITEKMHKYSYTILNNSRAINTKIIKMHRGMKDVTLSANPKEMAQSYALVNNLEEEILKHFDIIENRYLGDIADVESARNRFIKWKPIRAKIYTLSSKGNRSDAAYITKNEGAQYVHSLTNTMETFVIFANSKAQTFLQESQHNAESQKTSLSFLLAIIIIIGSIVAFYISRNISKLLHTIETKNRLLDNTVDTLNTQSIELNKAQHIAKVGSWRLDHISGELTWSNETFKIFEQTASHTPLNYESFLSYIHPDDRAKVDHTYSQAITNRQPYEVEHRILFPNGRIKYVREKSETSYADDGTLLMSFGTIQDISDEIKRKEEQKAQSRLDQMGEMLSMIAHQWRQPLTTIAVIASDLKIRIALGSIKDVDLIKQADTILEHTESLSHTINDFKNCFKPDTGVKEFQLAKSLENSLKLFEELFRKNDITIVQEIEEVGSITNYENEITQVILNILSNAVDAIADHNEAGGVITITIQSINRQQYISICDNAGGIASNDLEAIFDPYFSTKSKNGTGLGLYMSKVMIEEHCLGTMQATNSKGGACFILSFKEETE